MVVSFIDNQSKSIMDNWNKRCCFAEYLMSIDFTVRNTTLSETVQKPCFGRRTFSLFFGLQFLCFVNWFCLWLKSVKERVPFVFLNLLTLFGHWISRESEEYPEWEQRSFIPCRRLSDKSRGNIDHGEQFVRLIKGVYLKWISFTCKSRATDSNSDSSQFVSMVVTQTAIKDFL